MIRYPPTDSVPGLGIGKLIPGHIDDFDASVLQGMATTAIAIHPFSVGVPERTVCLYVDSFAVLRSEEQIGIGALSVTCHLFLDVIKRDSLVEPAFSCASSPVAAGQLELDIDIRFEGRAAPITASLQRPANQFHAR